MTQIKTITDFCKYAKYTMVRFPNKNNTEFGKIINNTDILKVDLQKQEIYRSIIEQNDNMLFIYDLKPEISERYVDSALQLVKRNLEDARLIEQIYPGIFRWVFDGVSVKGYAIIPSGDTSQHSTISRYGGSTMFYRILIQHLTNITKMARGKTPDYNFLKNEIIIQSEELSIGSLNLFNEMYSVGITPNMDYINVIRNSKYNMQVLTPLNTLRMKYWTKEINPDFIVEAKHLKLKNPLKMELKDAFKLYPQAIKNLMALKHKGNYYRYLLARFLLSAHKPVDAKFIYFSVLEDGEKQHIKSGNCKTQWNYVMNNMDRYTCPTFSELKAFESKEDANLSHPLELIQRHLDSEENGETKN